MQPLSGNQRPDLLTSLMNMSFVLRLPRKMHLCRSSSNVPRLPTLVKLWQNPHVSLRCRIPCACHAKSHLNLQKWSEHGVFLNILTRKRASRHNGAHFFDISISKSALNVVRFAHFDFEMCFAPQRRTFSTSQLQKVLRCFVHFDFDVLRVTTACNFSSRI